MTCMRIVRTSSVASGGSPPTKAVRALSNSRSKRASRVGHAERPSTRTESDDPSARAPAMLTWHARGGGRRGGVRQSPPEKSIADFLAPKTLHQLGMSASGRADLHVTAQFDADPP